MKHPQKKYFYSLNIKLMLVVLLAILSSLVVFWSMCKLEDYVADKVYLSDYAKKKALDSKLSAPGAPVSAERAREVTD